MHLVLAESEFELVPEAIRAHPSVRAPARRSGSRASRALLDSSLHHSALRALPEGERRGRPDIVHTVLLLAQDSILNQRGGLRVWIHTRNDELLVLDPRTRIMRNYNRFVGLAEQVLREGKAPPTGDPLLLLERGVTLKGAVARTGARSAIVFDDAGDRMSMREVLAPHAAAREAVACVIGGFPSGAFRADLGFADRRVSIHDAPLSAWTVASEAVVHWEQAIGVLG